LTVVPFPDGTGQIAIADGWSAKTLGRGRAALAGPRGGEISMGLGVALIDPAGEVFQTLQRRGMGESTELVVAYDSNPAKAFGAAYRAVKMQAGSPDPQVSVQDATPVHGPDDSCARIYVSGTELTGSAQRRFRGAVAIFTPSTAGGWFVAMNVMSAPAATLDDDWVTMNAMFTSFAIDLDALRAQVAGIAPVTKTSFHTSPSEPQAHEALDSNATPKPAADAPPLTVVKFQDGTGQIGIAPGWNAVRLGEGCAVVARPDGAHVTLGAGMYLLDPNGSTYQMYRRMYANTGMAPPAGLVVPYTADPAQAFVAVNRAIAAQTGKPDPQTHVESSKPLPAIPGGAAAYIDATAVVNGKPTRIRGNVFVLQPSADGGWSITVNVASAPEATFHDDEPVLLAMFNSYVLDNDARQKQIAASQAAFTAKAAEQNQTVFNTSMAGAHAAQLRIDKSTSNFIQGMFHSDA
jgi:hypothetical protein